MDVSNILAEQANRQDVVAVDRDNLELDLGFLTVTDPNPVDEEEYNRDLESYLTTTARAGIQSLIASLLQQPTQSTPDGPLTLLPAPTYQLPRAKHLPKPKPPTKWERFAAAKGITHKKRDKKEWDEERGEWVERWGARGAKSRKGENEWATEVKANADINANPEKELRDARKARVAKNERQRLQNAARSQEAAREREKRKSEIERTMTTSRVSTASMGKFDRKLEGEKKMRGVKRKFDPTERSVEDETKASLALVSKLGTSGKNPKTGGSDVLNVRKAIRTASKGAGGAALGRQQAKVSSKGKRRK